MEQANTTNVKQENKEINYKKWGLIEKTKFPKEILEMIKDKFKLELIHEKAKTNKKILCTDLVNIKRLDSYETIEDNVSVRLSNGNREIKIFNLPINHWIIHYEKNRKINWNQCARQMVHCVKCGEYRHVSRTQEQYMLIDSIRCNCNPFHFSFFNSKYFIPEMWFSDRYLDGLRTNNWD